MITDGVFLFDFHLSSDVQHSKTRKEKDRGRTLVAVPRGSFNAIHTIVHNTVYQFESNARSSLRKTDDHF